MPVPAKNAWGDFLTGVGKGKIQNKLIAAGKKVYFLIGPSARIPALFVLLNDKW